MTTREILTEEIIANARRDRKRLEAVANSLTTRYDEIKAEMGKREEESPLIPEVSAAFAEDIARLSDSLTRVNQQLVELVKIEHRRSPPEEQEKLGQGDVERVYDEIQPQEAN